MEPEIALQSSQKFYTGLYPEPDRSNPYHTIQNIHYSNY
jgi:hypothetical protein